ncbi:uncharacterized protein [Antedon mediterranea]|uniref:uncharacterized protein n=1 Tax=Antedon mediterranea TaxID=105859 RepID=UPI003AF7F3BE
MRALFYITLLALPLIFATPTRNRRDDNDDSEENGAIRRAGGQRNNPSSYRKRPNLNSPTRYRGSNERQTNQNSQNFQQQQKQRRRQQQRQQQQRQQQQVNRGGGGDDDSSEEEIEQFSSQFSMGVIVTNERIINEVAAGGDSSAEETQQTAANVGGAQPVVAADVAAGGDSSAEGTQTTAANVGGAQPVVAADVAAGGDSSAEETQQTAANVGGAQPVVAADVAAGGDSSAEETQQTAANVGGAQPVVAADVAAGGDSSAEDTQKTAENVGGAQPVVAADVAAGGDSSAEDTEQTAANVGGAQPVVAADVAAGGDSSAEDTQQTAANVGGAQPVVAADVAAGGDSSAEETQQTAANVGGAQPVVAADVAAGGDSSAEETQQTAANVGGAQPVVAADVAAGGDSSAEETQQTAENVGGAQPVVAAEVAAGGDSSAEETQQTAENVGGAQPVVAADVAAGGDSSAEETQQTAENVGGAQPVVEGSDMDDGDNSAEQTDVVNPTPLAEIKTNSPAIVLEPTTQSVETIESTPEIISTLPVKTTQNEEPTIVEIAVNSKPSRSPQVMQQTVTTCECYGNIDRLTLICEYFSNETEANTVFKAESSNPDLAFCCEEESFPAIARLRCLQDRNDPIPVSTPTPAIIQNDTPFTCTCSGQIKGGIVSFKCDFKSLGTDSTEYSVTSENTVIIDCCNPSEGKYNYAETLQCLKNEDPQAGEIQELPTNSPYACGCSYDYRQGQRFYKCSFKGEFKHDGKNLLEFDVTTRDSAVQVCCSHEKNFKESVECLRKVQNETDYEDSLVSTGDRGDIPQSPNNFIDQYVCDCTPKQLLNGETYYECVFQSDFGTSKYNFTKTSASSDIVLCCSTIVYTEQEVIDRVKCLTEKEDFTPSGSPNTFDFVDVDPNEIDTAGTGHSVSPSSSSLGPSGSSNSSQTGSMSETVGGSPIISPPGTSGVSGSGNSSGSGASGSGSSSESGVSGSGSSSGPGSGTSSGTSGSSMGTGMSGAGFVTGGTSSGNVSASGSSMGSGGNAAGGSGVSGSSGASGTFGVSASGTNIVSGNSGFENGFRCQCSYNNVYYKCELEEEGSDRYFTRNTSSPGIQQCCGAQYILSSLQDRINCFSSFKSWSGSDAGTDGTGISLGNTTVISTIEGRGSGGTGLGTGTGSTGSSSGSTGTGISIDGGRGAGSTGSSSGGGTGGAGFIFRNGTGFNFLDTNSSSTGGSFQSSQCSCKIGLVGSSSVFSCLYSIGTGEEETEFQMKSTDQRIIQCCTQIGGDMLSCFQSYNSTAIEAGVSGTGFSSLGASGSSTSGSRTFSTGSTGTGMTGSRTFSTGSSGTGMTDMTGFGVSPSSTGNGFNFLRNGNFSAENFEGNECSCQSSQINGQKIYKCNITFTVDNKPTKFGAQSSSKEIFECCSTTLPIDSRVDCLLAIESNLANSPDGNVNRESGYLSDRVGLSKSVKEPIKTSDSTTLVPSAKAIQEWQEHSPGSKIDEMSSEIVIKGGLYTAEDFMKHTDDSTQPELSNTVQLMKQTCARIVDTTNNTDGSILHTIDKVLQAPQLEVYDTISRDDRFSTLISLINNFDDVKEILNRDDVTFLAPTNDAFAKFKNVEDMTRDEQRRVLLYHIVNRRQCCDEFVPPIFPGRKMTAVGETVLVQRVRSGYGAVNRSRITECDITATNGVIHIINAVL